MRGSMYTPYSKIYMILRVRGLEHLPPVSTPFRRFLSRLTCWAPAQRRSLGAKITRKLPAHRCFAVFTEQNWAEARRRPQGILSYFQGLERSISPILPAKTDRGSSPLTLQRVYFCRIVYSVSSSIISSIALANTGSNCVPMPFSISSRATCCGSTSR